MKVVGFGKGDIYLQRDRFRDWGSLGRERFGEEGE